MTTRCQSPLSHALFGWTALLLLAACDSPPTAPKPIDALPRSLTAAEQTLIARSNGFAFSLFHEVSAQAPDSNLFMSPLSASMALGMTMNGAAGSTLDAMRSTLGLSTLSLEEADASYASLIELLRGLDPSVELRLANSIWYRQGLPVEQPFLDAATRFFDAEVQGLDFGSPSAADAINGWVEESTNGKIERIVDGIPPEAIMYLINAIYFKGAWTSEFDKAQTAPQPFFLADGSTQPVQMMHIADGSFPAAATEDYRAVELPYGGGAFAMLVLVPNEGTRLNDVIASLDADAWRSLRASLTEGTGDVYLPRFRLAWGDSLNAPLRALGMGVAFDPRLADFSRISTEGRLFINSVVQKAFVEVNEEGTEAAAATSVEIGLTSTSPVLIRADRPFLFAIEERLSGTIVFIGKMERAGSGL